MTCAFADCPKLAPPDIDGDICADCLERFDRALTREYRRQHVWNYRVVRYTLNGETLYGLMEVYYDAEGKPDGYGSATVTNWETPDALKGTLDLMHTALAHPVVDVDGDVAERMRNPISAPPGPPVEQK